MNRITRVCVTRCLVILAGLAVLPGGCGTSLKEADRARLSSVSIDPAVNIKGFTYFGGKAKLAAMVGGIPASVVVSALAPEKGEILQLMEKNHIDIGQILAAEFEKQLAAKPGFPQLVKEGGDAQFRFELSYGLSQSLLASRLKPELYVWANLKDNEGKTIWKSRKWANQHLPGYKHREYVQNPELLRQVLQEASAVVAKKFAETL